jgi:RNA polymerase sigma factor (sigma-70 family)
LPAVAPYADRRTLTSEGFDVPLFFLSAHGDIPAAVNAVQLGAIDFLQKPFKPQEFLDAINRVHRIARERHTQRLHRVQLQQLVRQLSGREEQVLDLLVKGYTSKEIAQKLGISPKTVDVHRASVIRKMGANNAAELNRMMHGES